MGGLLRTTDGRSMITGVALANAVVERSEFDNFLSLAANARETQGNLHRPAVNVFQEA
jgi:hypothetical protein